MNLNFKSLNVKFPDKIKLLYQICEYPVGILTRELNIICKESDINGWEDFMEILEEQKDKNRVVKINHKGMGMIVKFFD